MRLFYQGGSKPCTYTGTMHTVFVESEDRLQAWQLASSLACGLYPDAQLYSHGSHE